MNRRNFLRRIGAVAVAFTLARHLLGIAPEPVGLPVPAADEIVVLDRERGISMRFIKHWDIETPCRFDVIYGWAAIPDLAVRVQG